MFPEAGNREGFERRILHGGLIWFKPGAQPMSDLAIENNRSSRKSYISRSFGVSEEDVRGISAS